MEEISDVIVVSLMATFVSKNLLKIWFGSWIPWVVVIQRSRFTLLYLKKCVPYVSNSLKKITQQLHKEISFSLLHGNRFDTINLH